MKPTLIFCRDPAAAVQVTGLLANKEARRCLGERMGCKDLLANAVYFALPPALDMLRREGLQVDRFDDEFRGNKLGDVLRERNIGRIVTGTSDIDETGDLELWLAAAKEGLLSLCLLDRADESAARFKKRAVRPIFPNFIAVADEAMRDEAKAHGLPPERLLVVGNLRLSHIVSAMQRLNPDAREIARREWGATEKCFCVLFASECGREAKSAGRPQNFDEIAALECLLEWSESDRFRVDVSAGHQPRIIVRPHPRDQVSKYDAWISDRVALDGADHSAARSLVAADLVVGLESSLLEEALWLGTPALCLITRPQKDISA